MIGCENGIIVKSDDGYVCKCNDNFEVNDDGKCVEGNFLIFNEIISILERQQYYYVLN